MRAVVSEYDLVTPKALPEALELLSSNQGWRPMAGGTDLMVVFNTGKLAFQRFVSVTNIPTLRAIEVEPEAVFIGAAVTYTEIRQHPLLKSEFPLLCQAAGWTGGPANQNRGTLGGNIANASPAADSAPVLLACDAEIELTSQAAVRWLPYASFHVAYKLMQLRTDELITRIRLPRRSKELIQYARKVGARQAQAISKVSFVAQCNRQDDGLRNVRIAVGSVAPIPLRCYETERTLENQEPTSEVIRRAKEALAQEIHPISDIRSTDRYRARVALNLLGDFLERAR